MKNPLVHISVIIIRLYQKYLSPDHSFWARGAARPPYCRHIPSCSDYALEALEKRGFFKGWILAVWRILRCNPWGKGWYDPVPEKKRK